MIETGYSAAKSARASWAARSVFIGGSSRKPQASRAANAVAIRAGRYPEFHSRRAKLTGRHDGPDAGAADAVGTDFTGTSGSLPSTVMCFFHRCLEFGS